MYRPYHVKMFQAIISNSTLKYSKKFSRSFFQTKIRLCQGVLTRCVSLKKPNIFEGRNAPLFFLLSVITSIFLLYDLHFIDFELACFLFGRNLQCYVSILVGNFI